MAMKMTFGLAGAGVAACNASGLEQTKMRKAAVRRLAGIGYWRLALVISDYRDVSRNYGSLTLVPVKIAESSRLSGRLAVQQRPR